MSSLFVALSPHLNCILFHLDVDVFCGIKNQLYTAVKTGDSTALTCLLGELGQLAESQQIPIGNLAKLSIRIRTNSVHI